MTSSAGLRNFCDRLGSAHSVLAPPPNLKISEWADRYRRLAPPCPEPGQWRTSRAAYQREWMDACCDPEVTRVVVMKSAQVGATECLNNIVGYYIDQDPSSILVVMPTLQMAEDWSKDRFSSMLRATPRLRGKVHERRTKFTDNTILHKTFPGGHITVTGANSSSGLSSRPIRILLCDEVDRYDPDVGGEGDPVNLAERRTQNFWNRRVVLTSTPGDAKQKVVTSQGIEWKSRIESAWLQSDQRKFWVPCHKCGNFQVLEWENFQWKEADPSTAVYACPQCDAAWSDVQRWDAVAHGEWRPAAKFNGVAGFHIWEAYSPWRTAEHIVQFYMESDTLEKRKTFRNLCLGLPWVEEGDAPDVDRLIALRETYQLGTVPDGALLLTGGIDIQKDRIELAVYGWGRGIESWLVDYVVLYGDVYQEQIWASLQSAITAPYPSASHPKVSLFITRVAIDSQFETSRVRSWCMKQNASLVSMIRGDWRPEMPVGRPRPVEIEISGKSHRIGLHAWPVNVDMLKTELYGQLTLVPDRQSVKYPSGYCHFPQMDNEFFLQLTAERIQWHERRGARVYEWAKIRSRNEALDTRVYARAASIISGIDQWTEQNWQALEAYLFDLVRLESHVPVLGQSKVPPKPQPTSYRPWIDGRKGWF